MDLLTANDQPGVYPDSWYWHSANPCSPYPALEQDIDADVCIIGGGYTGLSTALHLAEAGYSCVVLEANRVGWGASGRNGGQVGSGFNQSQQWLEKRLGQQAASSLWQLSTDACQLVETLITRHGIDCDLQRGILYATHTQRIFREMADDAKHMREHYSEDQLDTIGHDEIGNWLASKDYIGGILNRRARHLHPLNYALGLGQAAAIAGVQIFENSRVENMQLPYLKSHVSFSGNRVQTSKASVIANHIVFACNGYLNELRQDVAARVMPINNYIVATEPFSASTANELIANRVAVADSRFVVNYFRMSQDNRLLFGGGESWGYKFPADIRKLVRRNLLQIYPQLHDAQLEFCWGGTLAITRERLPHAMQPAKNLWGVSGYSGHGVALATLAGKLISNAIQGNREAFDLLKSFNCEPFPGGSRHRSALLKVGMAWYALRDKINL